MRFINIGFSNMLSSDRILCILSPDSAPQKRLIAKAKDEETVIDATQGRKTRAVILLTSGNVVLSALNPETIAERYNAEQDGRKRP